MHVNLNKQSNFSVKNMLLKGYNFMKIGLFVLLKNQVTVKTIFISVIDKCILNFSFKRIF